MSALASAVLDSLQRLLPPKQSSTLLPAVVQALMQALEEGELGLDCRGPAPDGISPKDWPAAALSALNGAGWLVDAAEAATAPEAPIVQDGLVLRWRRWQTQLQQCLAAIEERAQRQRACSEAEHQAAMAAAAKAGLDTQQCQAVSAALRQGLVLLTGGPGTGKTSTVVQMLAACLRQRPGLRIQLAAPTGKAAARLASAVNRDNTQLPSSTLHRLLEAQGELRFGRNRRHPLELDLLVVDELSMVDLPLMAALLEALPADAQLLLIGDANQLPPVGTGAVLEELCRPERRPLLGDAAVELRTTYRNNGAIAALAEALRQRPSGPQGELLQELQPSLQALTPKDNVTWIEAPSRSLPPALLEAVQGQAAALRDSCQALVWREGRPDPGQSAALLAQLEELVVLSPIRQGPWGVEAVHRALLGDLAKSAPLHWPPGTPVLNRLNRPDQGLANGDIGVVVQQGSERRVLMPGQRLLHPAQLNGAEPAFALTVHKSQGSQYKTVQFLLPANRPLDPRLIYTGLTRAQRQAYLFTPLGISCRQSPNAP
jgi:exodeoxyribonuclease V alpha subunit